jgi:hypothetical protein
MSGSKALWAGHLVSRALVDVYWIIIACDSNLLTHAVFLHTQTHRTLGIFKAFIARCVSRCTVSFGRGRCLMLLTNTKPHPEFEISERVCRSQNVCCCTTCGPYHPGCHNIHRVKQYRMPNRGVNIQSIHKRIVQFQKSTRNLFLTLHGHYVHRQQRQLSKFLMH